MWHASEDKVNKLCGRVFVKMLSMNAPSKFSYESSKFAVHKSKVNKMDVCTDVCVDVVWMCTVLNWRASDVYMWVLIAKVVHCIFIFSRG